MQAALAFLTLLASVGLTYLFCIRPMRNGRDCRTCPPLSKFNLNDKTPTGVTAEELEAIRVELAALQANLGSDGILLTLQPRATDRHARESVAPDSGPAGGVR